MIIEINDNIKIWKEFNPIELAMDESSFDSSDPDRNLAKLGFKNEQIAIKDQWFDVIPLGELFHLRNKGDGYYRVVYVQINMENGEYYIGKANRPTWSVLKRYQGSGFKFKNKFKNNSDKFSRIYIAVFDNAEETETLEATLVDAELLADEKCLNLVAGGGGTTKHPSIAETSEKKREHMKKQP